MIVDPDFFDHWRTRMVVDELDDEASPIYIMRLWGHCQERKSDRFCMPSAGLKAQCRYRGDAAFFEQTLISAGFIERQGDDILVCGWAEKNASLVAAWANGHKGGRPKKDYKNNPWVNPSETHGLPNGNPTVTHGEPMANPRETDKIREDKIREEYIKDTLSEYPKKNEIVDNENEPKTPQPKTRGARLPKTWQPTAEDIEFCRNERPDLEPASVADQFRDYWLAQAGQKGVKVDWAATWRNWIRNQRSRPQQNMQKPSRHNGIQQTNWTEGINEDGSF